MTLTTLTDNLNKVQTLPDRPNANNGLSATELKAVFDEAANIIKNFINGTLIAELSSAAVGSSGAKRIGASSISDLTGNDVQTIISSLRDALKSVTSGSSGADFVKSAAISGVGGSTIYAQLVSVKGLIDAVYTKTQLDSGQMDSRYYTETELNSGQLDNRYKTTTSLQSAAPGISGSEILGSAPILGVSGTTVYTQLANIYSQLQGIVAGTIPDGTITPPKLSFVPATKIELDAHVVDYVKHPADGGTTGGSATAYTCASTSNPTAFADKMGVVIAAHLDSGASPTLKWGTLAAKPMLKANGSAAVIKKDGIYTWRYSVAKGAFILQGEGGDYGTAVAADVLVGKTIPTDAGLVNGAMKNRSTMIGGMGTPGRHLTPEAYTASPQQLFMKVPDGFWQDPANDLSWVYANESNFIAANIPTGMSMFGLVGTAPKSVYLSAPTARTTGSSTYVMLKKFLINTAGTVRISFYSTADTGKVKIYKNGAVVGTERSPSMQGATYIEDFTCNSGDIFEIYATGVSSFVTTVRDVLVTSVLPSPTGGVINVD